MSTVHELKCWPDFYQPIVDGLKTFDLRKDDRHFKVGDTIKLFEFDDRKGARTGRSLEKKIVYILQGISPGAIPPLHGLQRGYVILGLS